MILSAVSLWKKFNLKNPLGASELGIEEKDGMRYSHVSFSGYEIPGFSKLVDVAHRLHAQIPYLGLISWDLSFDKDGVPVLIEMNTTRQSAWFCQMVNGEPLFGENTAKILEMIRK